MWNGLAFWAHEMQAAERVTRFVKFDNLKAFGHLVSWGFQSKQNIEQVKF